jgi:hypothetical protein
MSGGRVQADRIAQRFVKEIIVSRRFRPWQAWQRPTLPSLEA